MILLFKTKEKFAVFFPLLPFPMFPTPMTPFFPVEGFSPQQIVRNARDRAESAGAEKMAPLAIPSKKKIWFDCPELYYHIEPHSSARL